MDTQTWILIAVAIAIALIYFIVAWRARQHRIVERFEVESVRSQEVAADRQAEADAILDESERAKRLASEAAERARELQAEADARVERSLELEAEAEQVTGEAAEAERHAEAARQEAARRR